MEVCGPSWLGIAGGTDCSARPLDGEVLPIVACFGSRSCTGCEALQSKRSEMKEWCVT